MKYVSLKDLDALHKEIVSNPNYNSDGKVVDRLGIKIVEIVYCEDCIYQLSWWHDDRRYKNKGYFTYFCKLCSDPFCEHSVCGEPGQFCSNGIEKEEVRF